MAAKVGARHGVAVNSATSAQHIACLGLGPGVRLWTSAITCVASANWGRYCGAKVDFVDMDPTTALINVAAVTSKLEQAEHEGTRLHPAEGGGAGGPGGQQLRHGSDWCAG